MEEVGLEVLEVRMEMPVSRMPLALMRMPVDPLLSSMPWLGHTEEAALSSMAAALPW